MENAIVEKMKSQVRNLKVLSEELELQMALGKAEAKDLLEKERKNISEFIEKQRLNFEEWESQSEQNRREFLTSVENLESVLMETVPEKARAYNDYKSRLLRRIYELEEVIKIHQPQWSGETRRAFESFEAKMDAFRVNLALHDKDNPQKVSKIKGEFTEKLIGVREMLADTEDDQSKLDSFMEDISESFSYFKRAIEKLTD